MSAISFQQRSFGTLETGEAVTCYVLRNTSGMTVNLLDYGATLSALQIPDSRGKMHDMTLSLCNLEDYSTSSFYSGLMHASLPPRYGKILNPLHRCVWKAENITQNEAASVTFELKSALNTKPVRTPIEFYIKLTYTLTVANELIVQTQIHTETPAPLNITHHPYWNLAGIGENDISSHLLQVEAENYCKSDAVDPSLWEKCSVENTAFDFRQPQRIGEKLFKTERHSDCPIYFELPPKEQEVSEKVRLAAKVKEPISGRTLEVTTTQQGLHFYLDQKMNQTALESNEPILPVWLCLSPSRLPHSSGDEKRDLFKNTSFQQHETHYKLVW